PDFLGKLLGSFVPFGSVLDLTNSLIGPVERQYERRHLILLWLLRKIVAATEQRRIHHSFPRTFRHIPLKGTIDDLTPTAAMRDSAGGTAACAGAQRC